MKNLQKIKEYICRYCKKKERGQFSYNKKTCFDCKQEMNRFRARARRKALRKLSPTKKKKGLDK